MTLCLVEMVWLEVIVVIRGEDRYLFRGESCLLKNVTGKQEMDMLCWIKCLNMNWLPRNSDETKEKKSLCSPDGDHWKAQQDFEQDQDYSRKYTMQRKELVRDAMSVGVLQASLGNFTNGTERNEANKLFDESIVLLGRLDACDALL